LLKKNGTFESGPKILMRETAEKIFKIGYGCGEMTLFVIHGRKIARILRRTKNLGEEPRISVQNARAKFQ